MKFSQLFTKTTKQVSAETESLNAQLLTRAGFIRQEIAGVYTYLPLGYRVLRKIEAVVREEMNEISTELHMPALSSKEPWEITDRLNQIDVMFQASGANDLSRERNSTEYILNSTHEDIVTPIAKQYRSSYKDLPFSTFQIQTKFRNEARAKSGLLRGREFLMKDLYSFHTSEEDLMKFYETAKAAYKKVYERLGIGKDTFIALASGGDFTSEYSHEFQTLLASGEDTIYLDRKNNIAYNKEIVTPKDAKKLGVDFDSLEIVTASEVGNIFPLGTKFSKAFNYSYVDDKNEHKLVWMGSYGIGISRLMGVVTEKFADEKGLVWPDHIAPFRYHIVALPGDENLKASEMIYQTLGNDACLLDDRADTSPGEKFGDADLIGCPVQIVISRKTLEQDSAEIVSRDNRFETFQIKINEIAKLPEKLK